MMVQTVYTTGHPINEEVCKAFQQGSHLPSKHVSQFKPSPYLQFDAIGHPTYYTPTDRQDRYGHRLVPAISYGFLRGAETIFKTCEWYGVEWWEIDRGYFKPGHYDGYYRLSRNGLQATYQDIDLPSDRWERLNIKPQEWKRERGGYVLVCPPTEAAAYFHSVQPEAWSERITEEIKQHTDRPIRFRSKGDANNTPLAWDIDNAWCVVGFNSNVLLEALIRGVPAISGSVHTTYGGWLRKLIADVEKTDWQAIDRQPLLNYLSYCQWTLEEMRSGMAWKISKEIQGDA